MKIIKFFITKLPLLSFVLISAFVLRIVGLGISIKNQTYGFNNPMYVSIFSTISQKNTLHGTTDAVAKGNISNEEKEETAHRKETYTTTEELKKNNQSSNSIDEKVELDENLLPEDTSRYVVDAVDYNISNPIYLDKEGTEYSYINDGIFSFHKEMRQFQEVDDSYFNDALFIGNSRSDGLYRYGNIAESTSFFALESITIYNIFEAEIPFHKYDSEDNDTNTKLESVLTNNQYKKIYISLGMNELGVPDTSAFRQEYIYVIEKIRQLQPDAIIYIEGIIHTDYENSSTDEAFNNKVIVQRNEAISKLANGYDIFYIDPNEYLCDKDGNLNSEYTNDGVHLKASYYPLWHEYLKKYAIVTE